MANDTALTVPATALLNNWMGHRRLTRRTIEAFAEDKLFSFSIGGMRTFADMLGELLGMELPVARGLATGTWGDFDLSRPDTKAGLLDAWDAATAEIPTVFAQIPAESLAQNHKAFGQWDGTGAEWMLYAIDNQVHHRAEGFVYLRALGIEPPAFFNRA